MNILSNNSVTKGILYGESFRKIYVSMKRVLREANMINYTHAFQNRLLEDGKFPEFLEKHNVLLQAMNEDMSFDLESFTYYKNLWLCYVDQSIHNKYISELMEYESSIEMLKQSIQYYKKRKTRELLCMLKDGSGRSKIALSVILVRYTPIGFICRTGVHIKKFFKKCINSLLYFLLLIIVKLNHRNDE